MFVIAVKEQEIFFFHGGASTDRRLSSRNPMRSRFYWPTEARAPGNPPHFGCFERDFSGLSKQPKAKKHLSILLAVQGLR
jgi:hypothetical protein